MGRSIVPLAVLMKVHAGMDLKNSNSGPVDSYKICIIEDS